MSQETLSPSEMAFIKDIEKDSQEVDNETLRKRYKFSNIRAMFYAYHQLRDKHNLPQRLQTAEEKASLEVLSNHLKEVLTILKGGNKN